MHVHYNDAIDHSRKYHNMPYCFLFVTPKFCIRIVFSFSWDHFNSQEKLKTILMQNGQFLCKVVNLKETVQ